jgi:FKBP-type peptidyl-prolyl cis-trans isomerase
VKGNKGRPLQPGDRVVVHYVCALSRDDLDRGNYVDSSEWLEAPLDVTVGGGQLLPGLEQLLSTADLGDTLRAEVPPELAFGLRGVPGRVPPDAMLYFDIELSTPSEFGNGK